VTSFNPEDVAARSSAFAKCALSCSACSLIRRHRTDKIQRERARASERERERKKERERVQESESGHSKALVLTSWLTPRFDWVYVHQNTGEHTHACTTIHKAAQNATHKTHEQTTQMHALAITVIPRCPLLNKNMRTKSTRFILHVLKRSAFCWRASCSSCNLRRNTCVGCGA